MLALFAILKNHPKRQKIMVLNGGLLIFIGIGIYVSIVGLSLSWQHWFWAGVVLFIMGISIVLLSFAFKVVSQPIQKQDRRL